jgi:hypothetical protein
MSAEEQQSSVCYAYTKRGCTLFPGWTAVHCGSCPADIGSRVRLIVAPKGQAERSTRHRTIDGPTALQIEERKDLANPK